MSTTVSPAYRVEFVADVFKLADDLCAVLKPGLWEKAIGDVLRDTVYQYDNQVYLTGALPDFKVLFNEQVEFTDPDELRSWFVFLKHVPRDQVFVLFRGVPHDMLSTVEQVPGVGEDYSYWDSSDSQLEHMSYEEWIERRVVWDEIIGRKSLNVRGLRRDVFEDYEKELRYSAAKKALGSVAGRVEDRTRVNNLLLFAWVKELQGVGVRLDPDELMSATSRWVLSGGDRSHLLYREQHPDLLEKCVRDVETQVAKSPVNMILEVSS